MNLIKQLQKTPKWKSFEEWYDKQNYSTPMGGYLERDYIVGFDDLEFEFTKGVFEKFIESQGYCIEQYQKYPPDALMWVTLFKQEPNTYGLFSGTFEELLIWYFNN